MRPFLSLVVAATASGLGFGLAWLGASTFVAGVPNEAPDPAAAVTTIAGALIAASGVLSLAIHWLGALSIGGVGAVLGLVAVLVPFGNPLFGGPMNPVYDIVRMLFGVTARLGDGASMFFFTGTALVFGAFLVAAALGVRSRRLSGPVSRSAARGAGIVGALTVLAALALLVVVGAHFAETAFAGRRHEAADSTLLVLAAALAGIGGLALRWSSWGAGAVGALAVVVGLVGFLAGSAIAPGTPGAAMFGYGLVLTIGLALLAAALAGLSRPRGRGVSAESIGL